MVDFMNEWTKSNMSEHKKVKLIIICQVNEQTQINVRFIKIGENYHLLIYNYQLQRQLTPTSFGCSTCFIIKDGFVPDSITL